MTIRFFTIAAASAVAIAVWSSGVARADVPTGQTIDGIRCDSAEGSVFHIHQHVAIYDHGKPIAIPDDVGRPVVGNCLYWMHTHTSDGIIHVESPVFKTFTLGDLFDVWGQPLTRMAVGPVIVKKGQVRTYVDGQPFHGDPRTIEMTLHADIVLEAGPPYVKPKPFTDWQGQ